MKQIPRPTVLKSLVLISLGISSQSCLVSRTACPNLSGYVYDANSKRPLEGCKVSSGIEGHQDTLTDAQGYFRLPEKRYMEVSWIGMEAPPLRAAVSIRKDGYKMETIDLISSHGGGLSKGSHWVLDKVYLKSDSE